MKSQKHLNFNSNMNSSFSASTEYTHHKESFPKLTVSFENQQYSLPINKQSTIKKLALQLLVMLYEQLLEQELDDGLRQVHSTICEILVQEVNSVIQTQRNRNIRDFLSQMIHEYEIQKIPNSKDSQPQSNRYFAKNYMSTLRKSSNKNSQHHTKNISERSVSTQNFKLYEKGQKSIERKRKLQKQNAQQKSKVEISYCTFAPNISKSQQKFSKKQTSNVFKRLYEDAQEAKIKNFFKRKQIENKEQKVNSSYKFAPDINQCSKLIVRLKEKQQEKDKILYGQLDNSQTSFLTQNSSQKLLKEKSSRKVFQKLYDSSFYQNRMNKTLNKVNQENKQNSFTYHPELSAGTKRITQHYPKLQKRMEIYNMKKSENTRSSPHFSHSKEKSLKKIPSKVQLVKQARVPCSNTQQKKGIKKMLERIKTEPLQQIDIIPYNQTLGMGQYNSQIFQLQSGFLDDQSVFEVTPKKLNLDHQNHMAFFKVKQTKGQKSFQQAPETIENNDISLSLNQTQKKAEIFTKIFIELSMDSEEITSRKIQSNRTIPSEIRQILNPLTQELSEMDTQLDEEEFVWSLENLYDQLQIEKKAMLLSWGLKLMRKNKSFKIKTSDNLRHVKTQGSVFELIQ